MSLKILVTLLILILLPGAALAETSPRIEPDEGDLDAVDGKKMFVISGWLGEDNVFTKSLRLTAEGGDVEEFIFLPSDLKLQTQNVSQDNENIGRERVALIGEQSLSENIPKDFLVNVTDVRTPGIYEGNFDLLIPGQNRDDALSIPLRVVAKAQPQITPEPGTSPVQLSLVNCKDWTRDKWIGCGLASVILNDGRFQDEYELEFDNPVHADVRVEDTNVSVRGDNTGIQLNDQLKLKDTATFDANRISSLLLSIDRSRIAPDHYTGTIALTMEGATERLRLPVDLNVRTGPTWVIAYLILGLLLGQAQRLLAETGQGAAQNEGGARRVKELILGVDVANVNNARAPWEVRLRLLLKVALLVGLVWVGIETFYVNQGLFFGANPLTDYLSLVLWGLSADVISRNLSELRG